MFDPTPVNVATVMFLKGANNPHTGMLLIDFMLQKDGGQQVLRNANYLPVHPKVSPKYHMKRIVPSIAGMKAIIFHPDNQGDMRKERLKLLKDHFHK
jgi:ABC-type Fe3+ transport system substrate-binding protein